MIVCVGTLRINTRYCEVYISLYEKYGNNIGHLLIDHRSSENRVRD